MRLSLLLLCAALAAAPWAEAAVAYPYNYGVTGFNGEWGYAIPIATGQADCAAVNLANFGTESVLKSWTASGYATATNFNKVYCIPIWADGCNFNDAPGWCNTWNSRCEVNALRPDINVRTNLGRVCSSQKYFNPLASVRSTAIPVLWFFIFTGALVFLILRALKPERHVDPAAPNANAGAAGSGNNNHDHGHKTLTTLSVIVALLLWTFGTIILFSPYMLAGYFAFFFALLLLAVAGSRHGTRVWPGVLAFLVLSVLLLILWGQDGQREQGGQWLKGNQACTDFYGGFFNVDTASNPNTPTPTRGVVEGDSHNPLRITRSLCARETQVAMLFFYALVLASIACGAALMLAAAGADLAWTFSNRRPGVAGGVTHPELQAARLSVLDPLAVAETQLRARDSQIEAGIAQSTAQLNAVRADIDALLALLGIRAVDMHNTVQRASRMDADGAAHTKKDYLWTLPEFQWMLERAQPGQKETIIVRESTRPSIGFELTDTTKDYGPKVVKLHAGGAAQRAGILENDVVTSFGPHDIQKKQQFGEILKQYQAGDRVVLGLLRPGAHNVILTEVTLDPWKPQPGSPTSSGSFR
jgi:hypothetical protein